MIKPMENSLMAPGNRPTEHLAEGRISVDPTPVMMVWDDQKGGHGNSDHGQIPQHPLNGFPGDR